MWDQLCPSKRIEGPFALWYLATQQTLRALGDALLHLPVEKIVSQVVPRQRPQGGLFCQRLAGL
jgi:hypothetical protein